MLLALLKILHYLALAVGLGGGVANAVIGAKASAKAPEVAGPIQKTIGRLSFVALILLWATGLWMVSRSGTEGLGLWFYLKIACVVVLTAAALTAQVLTLRPSPTTPATMKSLGMVMTGAATLAVVFAVLAFG